MAFSTLSTFGYQASDLPDSDATYVLAQRFKTLAETLAVSAESINAQSHRAIVMTTDMAKQWMETASRVASAVTAAQSSYLDLHITLVEFSAKVEEVKRDIEQQVTFAEDAQRRRAAAWDKYRQHNAQVLELRADTGLTGQGAARLSHHEKQQQIAYLQREKAMADYDQAHARYKALREQCDEADERASQRIDHLMQHDNLGRGALDNWARPAIKGWIKWTDGVSTTLATASTLSTLTGVGAVSAAPWLCALSSVGGGLSFHGELLLLAAGDKNWENTLSAGMGVLPFGFKLVTKQVNLPPLKPLLSTSPLAAKIRSFGNKLGSLFGRRQKFDPIKRSGKKVEYNSLPELNNKARSLTNPKPNTSTQPFKAVNRSTTNRSTSTKQYSPQTPWPREKTNPTTPSRNPQQKNNEQQEDPTQEKLKELLGKQDTVEKTRVSAQEAEDAVEKPPSTPPEYTVTPCQPPPRK